VRPDPSEPIDLRRRHRCPECGKEGRPLLRMVGMPAPDVDWELHERQGRYTVVGCLMDDHAAPYECRHCGADLFLEGRLRK